MCAGPALSQMDQLLPAQVLSTLDCWSTHNILQVSQRTIKLAPYLLRPGLRCVVSFLALWSFGSSQFQEDRVWISFICLIPAYYYVYQLPGPRFLSVLDTFCHSQFCGVVWGLHEKWVVLFLHHCYQINVEQVSEWLLFNSTVFSAIYRGENKLSQRDDDEVRFVLDQHS